MGDQAPQDFLTPDAVKGLVTEAVVAALAAANTVADADRPEAVKSAPAVPNVITRRQAFPSLRRAMLRASKGRLDGLEAEYDAAAKQAFGYNKPDSFASADGNVDDGLEAGSIIWPTTMAQAYSVFETMGAKKESAAVDLAIKSMEATRAFNNDSAWTDSGGTAGGLLVPPEFAQSLFGYALTAKNAVRRAGATVYPATSNNVKFPRETVVAGASQAAEAGTMSSADATFAQQSIDVEKQYAFRRWSDELGADSDPAFNSFLENTVIRDLRVQQDQQYLRGSGSTPQIQGIIGYTSLTTGPSLGTNGRKLNHDDVLEAEYLLNAVDADANFAISHYRAKNTLRKEKDSAGRYLMSLDGTPRAFGPQRADGPDAILADSIPFYGTTNILLTETVGSSTDTSTMIVGDISQVFIIERGGLELMFSPHVYFTTGEMAVRATHRTALVILQPSAVLTITGIRP